jgi:hypothetical protein
VKTAIEGRKLAACALLDDDAVILAPSNVHPNTTLRQWRAGEDVRRLYVVRELSPRDLAGFTGAQVIESLVLLQFVCIRPLVRDSIATALADLAVPIRGDMAAIGPKRDERATA